MNMTTGLHLSVETTLTTGIISKMLINIFPWLQTVTVVVSSSRQNQGVTLHSQRFGVSLSPLKNFSFAFIIYAEFRKTHIIPLL